MFRILLKDFLSQRLAMKIVLLIGWLCVIVMALALFSPYFDAVLASASA